MNALRAGSVFTSHRVAWTCSPAPPRCELAVALRQDFMNDVSMHVGQAAIAAVVAIGELLVIDPQKMEKCGMQVVARQLGSRPPAPFVAFAVAGAALNAG